MLNLRPFEIVLIAVFGVFAIGGVIMIAFFQAKPNAEELLYGDRVIIWGTLDQRTMNTFLAEAQDEIDQLHVVSYKQIDERYFERTLVDAIAEGQSPDMIIIPQSQLVSHRSKLLPISYEAISQRTFRDAYIDGAEIFMMSDGVYGIPFAVNPLLMYWNRDIFAQNGYATYPASWEQIVSETAKKITRVDDNRNIYQSTIAFGEYRNVRYAKEVLSTLLLQAGSNIVEEKSSVQAGQYTVTLRDVTGAAQAPIDSAVAFYMQFSNPTRAVYSWNRAQSSDEQAFIGETLALYFALGSARDDIEAQNPNLNYDVAPVPQGSGATISRTYADFYAFAIPKASTRASGAYNVALLFASPQFSERLSSLFGMAPAHRSLYTGRIQDPFTSVLYSTSLTARGWLDPSPTESDTLLREMVEEAGTGDAPRSQVIYDMIYKLEALF